MVHALNYMMFAVSVPVLSANMYLIEAISSWRVMLMGYACFMEASSYISISFAIKGAYTSFINSIETTRDIGMIVLSRIKYTP